MAQNEFLHKMGIRQRLQVSLYPSIQTPTLIIVLCLLHKSLLNKASPSETEHLLSGYEMLTSPEKMGERFKFLTITSSPSHIPTPFVAGVEPFPVNTDPITDSS